MSNILNEAASAVLAEQIETMRGDQVALIATGFDPGLASCVVNAIKNGAADMIALRGHGVEIALAIEICEAIAARRARLNAAVARINDMSKSVPVAHSCFPLPAPAPEPIGRIAALSLLHDLCLAIDAGRCEVSTLSRAGFSEIASAELAHLINSTREI